MNNVHLIFWLTNSRSERKVCVCQGKAWIWSNKVNLAQAGRGWGQVKQCSCSQARQADKTVRTIVNDPCSHHHLSSHSRLLLEYSKIHFNSNFCIEPPAFKFSHNVVNWSLSQISQDKKIEISSDKEMPITGSVSPEVRYLGGNKSAKHFSWNALPQIFLC